MGIIVFMMLGCHSIGIHVGDEPTYRREPPSEERGGPPPWAPAHGYRAKHRYRYYPSSHVYCDTSRGIYFYYEGGTWRAGASLPASVHIDVGDYVSLEMDTDEPYRYHSEVIKRYPPGQEKKKGKGKGKG